MGDLDAVGLVEALSAGDVSASELVDAAIARTEAVNPTLNGLAYAASDRARRRAGGAAPLRRLLRRRTRPSSRTTSTSRACPPCRAPMPGIRAPCPPTAIARATFLATGLIPLGKTQLSEFGFSAAAEHPRIGPVRNPWNPDHTAGASSSGLGRIRRRRRGADRACQRWRRLDPYSGLLQRVGGIEADPRPVAAGQADATDAAAGRRTTVWSPDRSATPRRSSARRSGSRATRNCGRSATSPDRAISG